MAGAGYKLFNTGDVLTAAQVNTYLQEQTVMVFASSAARTSALSGVLAEGMMSYLQDTNAVEVYNGTSWTAVGGGGLSSPLTTKGDVWGYSTTNARIPIGANNTVLTADSAQSLGLKWAAVSSGLTLITSGTLSGTSISLDNVFSATYDSYLLCWIVTTTDGEQRIRFRASGTDNTSANYRYANAALDVGATPNFATLSGSGGTDFTLGLPAGVGSNRYGYCLNILSPFDSSVTTKYNGTFYRGANGGGFAYGAINSNTSFDGITVYNTGSTWSGTYQVYGYAK